MHKIYVHDITKALNISESKLRYYDKHGLIRKMQRDNNNYRFIFEEDLVELKTIICLKQTGLSLMEIKHYLQLAYEGNSTIDEREQILLDQYKNLNIRFRELKEQQDFLDYKLNFYKELKEKI